MATVKYDTTDSYVQVTQVGSDLDFIIQNRSPSHSALLVFADSAPGATDPAHSIAPGGSMIRAGVSGNVYVKSRTEGLSAPLSVSAASGA